MVMTAAILQLMTSIQNSHPKSSRSFIFGAIFIGFLLNCGVFLFSSIMGMTGIYESPWITYLILSAIAGVIWMRDGDGSHDSKSINAFSDGLGFKRDGHGPLAIIIGLSLLFLGIFVLFGNGINIIIIFIKSFSH
jgi:hypothetical protein